jgi:uncharacterized protein YbbC (DUF1343 family)
VNSSLNHSLDLLHSKLKLKCAFGPQHGAKGDKQDNMLETKNEIHPKYGIPIYSLYGEVRRPTEKMLNQCDVVLFDLQDLGCRIYTFITTLLHIMEECSRLGKSVVVLDRPNPAGRTVEGFKLIPGYESFVGAGPMPMRHGLTVGELAIYFKKLKNLNLDLTIVKMRGYFPEKSPGFGWPSDRSWINPSPNAPTLNMARVYSGSVLIEGTTLSEGRGTTRALELVGAPDIDFAKIHQHMKKIAPQWLKGATIREMFFEPTFHKHAKELCSGLQFHTDIPGYKPQAFKPYRAFSLVLKSIHELYPDYPIFRDFAYEYVTDKLAFDVINGSPKLRNWIEDAKAKPGDLELLLRADEKSWRPEKIY